MQRAKLTSIRFPHEIRNGSGSTMGLDIRIDGHHVIVRQTAHQVHGNFFIHSTTGYTVAFDPEIVEPEPAGSDEKPPKLFVVVTLAEMERRQAEAQRHEADAQRRDDEREAREKETQARYRTAEQVLHHIEMKTAPSWRDPSHLLPPVRVERVAWVDNHPHAKFVIENLQPIQARDIVEIRLSDGRRSNVRAEIVVLDTPGDDDNRLPATILPGEKAQGVVRIPDELKGRLETLTMSFYGPDGGMLYSARIGDYMVELLPKEEYERREARLRRAKQLFLGPSVSLGACWLSDGEDETNLDSTSCMLLGLRLTKGINEMFAFEAEAIGGWTGDASFDSGTRSSRFGRVSLGGVLRFGEYTIPYARLAVGAQGISHDGLDSSTEFTPLTVFGAGLARRFGDQFIAAASVSAVTRGWFERLDTIGLGVHFGYGWNP